MGDRLAAKIMISIGLICLGIGMLNWVVDPFGLHGDWPLKLGPFKNVPTMPPEAKVALLGGNGCERILVGSSRAEFALDPEDPHWNGMRTCNLGLSGSSIRDQAHLIEEARAKGPLKEVIWALDFQAFAINHRHLFDNKRSGWASGPFSLLSWNRLAQSFSVLTHTFRGERSGYTALGFLARPGFKALSLTRFQNDIRDYTKDSQLYAGFAVDPEASAIIQRTRSTLKAQGIRIRFLILPVHAVHGEIMRLAGLDRVHERWLEELEQNFGPIPHFASYSFPNDEEIPSDYRKMRWFWDSNHITREYGGLVVEELFSSAPHYAQTSRTYDTQEAERLAWLNRSSKTLSKLGLR